MRILSLAFCLVLAAACSQESPIQPGPVDQQVILAPGQSVSVQAAGLTVLFEKVTGDSRCPADAMCITGGDAIVRLQVTPTDGHAVAKELHTGSMLPVRQGDVTIALVSLSPYPFSSRTIAPDEYRATLRVTR